MGLWKSISLERWRVAMNSIICVYQDCPLCGDKGKAIKRLIFDKKLDVRTVSFASQEGRELCHEATFNHKIKTMPFFTDGVRFSTRLESLLEESGNIQKRAKTQKKSCKSVKKSTEKGCKNVKEGAKNGVDS